MEQIPRFTNTQINELRVNDEVQLLKEMILSVDGNADSNPTDHRDLLHFSIWTTHRLGVFSQDLDNRLEGKPFGNVVSATEHFAEFGTR